MAEMIAPATNARRDTVKGQSPGSGERFSPIARNVECPLSTQSGHSNKALFCSPVSVIQAGG